MGVESVPSRMDERSIELEFLRDALSCWCSLSVSPSSVLRTKESILAYLLSYRINPYRYDIYKQYLQYLQYTPESKNIMGCCASCFKTSSNSSTKETEMTETMVPNYSFRISQQMSAPTVNINRLSLTGSGLALVDVSLEQDACYWEWHIEIPNPNAVHVESDEEEDDFFSSMSALQFGVCTKKTQEFYKTLGSQAEDDELEGDGQMDDGTQLMKPIVNLQHGDVVGVAVQQSDLPMVQFLLNGEPLHDLAINRFRGKVYPSVLMREGYKVKFVWDENEHKELSPHVRFGPLIPERGLI